MHFVDGEKHCKTHSGPICTMYLPKIEIAHFCARQFRTPVLSAPILNIASSSSYRSKNLCLGKMKLTEAENFCACSEKMANGSFAGKIMNNE